MKKKKYLNGNLVIVVACIVLAVVFIETLSYQKRQSERMSKPLANSDETKIDGLKESPKDSNENETTTSNLASQPQSSSETSNSNNNQESNSNASKQEVTESNTNKPVTIPNSVTPDSGVIKTGKLKIINKCSNNALQALDEFYQDSEYTYYFNTIKSNCTYVQINGSEYTVKFALNSHLVTIKELENVGFKCLKKARHLATK